MIALIAKEDDEKKNAVPKKVGGKVRCLSYRFRRSSLEYWTDSLLVLVRFSQKRGIDEVKGGGGSSRASTPASEKKAKAVKRPKTSDVVKPEPKAV